MDDIQFLAKKERTQEELFHLFNTLYESNRQIIFSSDRHPAQLANIEDRLKSRFSAGMLVEITPPDHDSRIAILTTKASLMQFPLDQKVADYLASVLTGSIRELEGILNALLFQTNISNRPLIFEEVQSLVSENVRPKRIVSVKEVIKTIADFYNLDESVIYEKTRRKEVVKPRQIIMYILREDFSISYPTIGARLGGRDHTTVIHSCEKIKGEVKTDFSLAQEIETLRGLLQ
jgi:chromosomal replication initiator protein